jgi:hypothetical protein
VVECLALRQQLANLRRTSCRRRLRASNRGFWVVLFRLWSRWPDVLVVVKPDTLVRWHRAGFRLFWRWKSRSHSPVVRQGVIRPACFPTLTMMGSTAVRGVQQTARMACCQPPIPHGVVPDAS